jgi:nicotinamide riboside kinase
MTKIVNFLGGAGSGKSTGAAALFAELKKRGVNVELASEYAKDLVWEDRLATLGDQIYVFGHQHHRLHRLMGKVDIVITDSPLLLSSVYNPTSDDRGRALDALVTSVFKHFDNINFLLRRTMPYQKTGRIQTEKEAVEVDKRILTLLETQNIPYIAIDPSADADRVSVLADRVLNLL